MFFDLVLSLWTIESDSQNLTHRSTPWASGSRCGWNFDAPLWTGLKLRHCVDPPSADRSLAASGGSVHLHLFRSPTSTQCETGIVRTRPEPRDPLLRSNDCALKNLSTRQSRKRPVGSTLHFSRGMVSANRNIGRGISVHALYIYHQRAQSHDFWLRTVTRTSS